MGRKADVTCRTSYLPHDRFIFLSTLETSCSTQLLLHLPLRNQLSGRVELETGTKKTTQSPFQFDRRHAEAILAKNGPGDSETPNDEATDGGPQESESSGKPFEVVASYATRGEESILSLRRLHWIAFRNGWSLLSLWASAIFMCMTMRQPM